MIQAMTGMSFLASISQEQPETKQAEDDDEVEPPTPKIKTYQAVSAIEDVQMFLDGKGHNELATKLESQMNSMSV